jgi:arsenate reductase
MDTVAAKPSPHGTGKSRHIVFVCLHGSAKSLIAAEYLNRKAAEAGLDLRASSAGKEPDPGIPPHVVEGLRERGFDVAGRIPVSAKDAGLATAHRVIAFGCGLDGIPTHGAPEQWADCPAVSEGFEPAWRHITLKVDQLLSLEPKP